MSLHLIGSCNGDTLRLITELQQAARRDGLGVTIVFDCVAGAGGERYWTTDYADAVKNRRNASPRSALEVAINA